MGGGSPSKGLQNINWPRVAEHLHLDRNTSPYRILEYIGSDNEPNLLLQKDARARGKDMPNRTETLVHLSRPPRYPACTHGDRG